MGLQPAFVNKVLWAHSHIRAFTHCRGCSPAAVAVGTKLETCARRGPPQKVCPPLKLRGCPATLHSVWFFSQCFLLFLRMMYLLCIYILCKLCPVVEGMWMPGRDTIRNKPCALWLYKGLGGLGSFLHFLRTLQHRASPLIVWFLASPLPMRDVLGEFVKELWNLDPPWGNWGHSFVKNGYELGQGWALCKGHHSWRLPAPSKCVGTQNGHGN